VLAASLALGLLFWQWQPLPASAWHLSAQPWAALIWLVYTAGWLLTVATTFMIDHLDFLGLRQAYAHTRQRPYQPPSFTERWLYAWVRHPMMLGLIIVFWATPAMTAGHLLFAAAGSAPTSAGPHPRTTSRPGPAKPADSLQAALILTAAAGSRVQARQCGPSLPWTTGSLLNRNTTARSGKKRFFTERAVV